MDNASNISFGIFNKNSRAYTAYGGGWFVHGALLAFNGGYLDVVIGSYHLGQGKRSYNPVLMRFAQPDELSPFGAGGAHAYAYCLGDPINRLDPDAQSSVKLKSLIWTTGRLKALAGRNNKLKLVKEAGKWGGAIGSIMVSLEIPGGAAVTTVSGGVVLAAKAASQAVFFQKKLRTWMPHVRHPALPQLKTGIKAVIDVAAKEGQEQWRILSKVPVTRK